MGWVVWLGCALCLCGCTASHYRTSADKQVYNAIARRAPLVTNMEPRFTIEHTNALVLEGLPEVTVTNDFLGEAARAELGAHVFSLKEALKIGVQHSRIYQNGLKEGERVLLRAVESQASEKTEEKPQPPPAGKPASQPADPPAAAATPKTKV